MKLIFIYGPPAVGKTTIGGKLSKLTGYRFFFNHLTVPAAKAIFPDSDSADRDRSERYWHLLKRLRLDVIETAADEGLDTIFTSVYQSTIDDDFVSDVVAAVTSRGGEVNFVQLVATEQALMERVDNESRKDLHMGKMTERLHLKRALVPGMFESVKYADVLKLDTNKLSAHESAMRIVSHFHLTANE